MKNTDKVNKVIANFLCENGGLAVIYKNEGIILYSFSVLDNGQTFFQYFDFNENTISRETIETPLFSKLFSIDINSLLP